MAAANEFIRIETAANGAPAREPEVWDERIEDFNPLFGHAVEAEPMLVSPSFDVAEYLGLERTKDLLRFSTAGSVDDGKSTLIGRLLYDTQSVYDDQIRSIEGKGTTAPGVLDLALLTDGLRAEREQGITIDVAYRYFSTARRKFIIADTPGMSSTRATWPQAPLPPTLRLCWWTRAKACWCSRGGMPALPLCWGCSR